MNQSMPAPVKAHSVRIDARSRAVISGVEDVALFSGEKILAVTHQGAISILGEGMQVENLNISDGELVINGKIDAFSYDERAPKEKSALKRLFR